jgi:hypothetical protein
MTMVVGPYTFFIFNQLNGAEFPAKFSKHYLFPHSNDMFTLSWFIDFNVN